MGNYPHTNIGEIMITIKYLEENINMYYIVRGEMKIHFEDEKYIITKLKKG